MVVKNFKKPELKPTIANLLAIFLLTSCASEPVEPLPALPTVPDYIQVPHPPGYDLGDVTSLFFSPLAPKKETLKSCDKDVKKLRSHTNINDEIASGTRELILRDPKFYHWCFYYKIEETGKTLNSSLLLWSEKQKILIDNYQALVPLAQAFRAEFNDARYLKWAVKQYRDGSEWVFFRKVELSPQSTQDLMEGVNNPFALWRKPTEAGISVLDKYGFPKDLGPLPESPVAGRSADKVEQYGAMENAKTVAPISRVLPVNPVPEALNPVPATAPVASQPASAPPVNRVPASH